MLKDRVLFPQTMTAHLCFKSCIKEPLGGNTRFHDDYSKDLRLLEPLKM